MAGLNGFREGFMTAGAVDDATFGAFDARKTRYDILWSFFENTSYRNIHSWAVRMKTEYGLYRYTRNIYNPSYRLGEFYRTHLLGGALDPAAGDGQQVPSALPITTDNEALRPALATLWRDSNWAVNKDIFGLWGTIMGDVGLRVIDDVAREKVYLKTVNASTLKDVTLDDFGNVKGYQIEETRPDPRPGKKSTDTIVYGEIAMRDGDDVVFQTLLDGKPYAYDGEAAEWRVAYGFVPLVLTQHNNVGLNWGWSELYPCLSKIREVDDIASKLSDQVRKMVDAPWLFAGVDKPKDQITARGNTAQTSRPEPGREEIPALYGPLGATATALVAPLDIAATVTHLASMLQELEREFPELQMDIWTASGESSGRALRTARQRTTTKVAARRAGYDNAIVRAQQMAVAIGGWRGYPGYEGFNLDSYAAGALDHSIGTRPVFEPDPLDKIEEDEAFWKAAKAAGDAGCVLEVYLEDAGWSKEKIAKITNSPEHQARLNMLSIGFGSGDNGSGNNSNPPDNADGQGDGQA